MEYTSVVAPCFTLRLSTYPMRSMTSFWSKKSVSQPPKAVVKLNFPSEKAPAPPKPHMVPHTLHWTQVRTLPATMGHWRR